MVTKSPNYSAIIDAEAERIVNDLAEIRGLLEHNLSLGTAVEQTIAKTLQKFLPTIYEVTSGFAVNADGNLSSQQDILIVRKHRIGPLSTYAGFGIYPIEHILASIEIKTKLTLKELQSAMNTIEGLASLAPKIPGESHISKKPGNLLMANIPICAPYTGIFALETDIAIGKILNQAKSHKSNSVIGTRLNGIHVLNHSVTCWVDKTGVKYPSLITDPQATNVKGCSFDWDGRPLELATSETNANETLKLFLGDLLSFLNWYRPPPIDLKKYLFADLKLKFDVVEKI